jgi:hypothetical protein
MAELHLPNRKPAMDLLGRLGQADRDRFQMALLDALWDAHEADTLPSEIVVLLRDWTAHAHFEDSPIAQQRIAEVRRSAASV